MKISHLIPYRARARVSIRLTWTSSIGCMVSIIMYRQRKKIRSAVAAVRFLRIPRQVVFIDLQACVSSWFTKCSTGGIINR